MFFLYINLCHVYIDYLNTSFLFLLACITVLAEISNILNKKGKSEHFSFVPTLRKKNDFNFSLLDIQVMCLSYVAITVLRYSSYIAIFDWFFMREFYHFYLLKWCFSFHSADILCFIY